jgi:CDP-diacylglycerol--glycerol-3-phosphate 3-phosphatidyltransferase
MTDSAASPHKLAWLPNALTMARVALAPLILIVLAASLLSGDLSRPPLFTWGPPTAAALLGVAGLLDWLDGKLARAFEAQSNFGRFWDPIADKLVIGGALIGGSIVMPTILFVLPAAVIIWRDAYVTWMRLRPGASAAAIAAPLRLAQWKTAAEFTALLVLLGAGGVIGAATGAATPGSARVLGVTLALGLVLLWVAAGLALWTGWRYFRAARAAGKGGS